MTMANEPAQPPLRGSHDALVTDHPARFYDAATNYFSPSRQDEMNEKSIDDNSIPNMKSTPTTQSEDSTDRDIEKDAEAPDAKAEKDEPPKDPN